MIAIVLRHMGGESGKGRNKRYRW